MALSGLYLSILKYIHKNRKCSIVEVAKKFMITPSTIRRHIDHLNLYLPKEDEITIKKGDIYLSMNYDKYITFINNIPLNQYASTIEERVDFILIKSFFKNIVNASLEYNKMYFSLTTKVKDLKLLRLLIKNKELNLKIHHRRGIEIVGNELRYRLMVIEILLKLTELNSQFIIERRRANTPIENLIVDEFFQQYNEIKYVCQKQIINFCNKINNKITYNSKKILLLYIALINIRKKTILEKDISDMPIMPLNFYFHHKQTENIAFNCVIAMLDFHNPLSFPENNELMKLCVLFVEKITNNLNVEIYTKKAVVIEIYHFMYRSLFGIYLGFYYKDKISIDTKEKFSELFNMIALEMKEIENTYNIKFTEGHYTTATLIMQKWISKNEISRFNKKKIIIVSNTTHEHISFFVESLADLVEIDFVGYYNIHELDTIKNINFDWIITVSERVHNIVLGLNLPSIQVNFILEDDDIEYLLKNGFSKKRYKCLAESFLVTIEDKSQKEIKKILTNEYGDIFI
ncbi:MAG: helix-turn-helix domain-containing protein [Alphaproteobacteria bacterium]|jgi:transcriptional antiterminator|nr:helix-turn-helix domain-containing protein [Alphaproteobacteria bacterium]